MNSPMNHPLARPYIAGFDVFRQDAREYYEAVKEFAAKLNLDAQCPFDPAIDPHDADAIYQKNITLMRLSDSIVADITPFRGSEPDSGMAFELGMMKARNCPVVLHTTDWRTEGEKQVDYFRSRNWNLDYRTTILPDRMYRNPHNSVVNLMLGKSATKIVNGDVRDGLLVLREYLLKLREQKAA